MEAHEIARGRRCFMFLHTYIQNALIRHGLTSWQQVAAAPDRTILAIKRLGPAALADIRREQRLAGF